MNALPIGTAPCAFMADGRLCGRTDDRPIVLDAGNVLGWICLEHRPSLAPKPVTIDLMAALKESLRGGDSVAINRAATVNA